MALTALDFPASPTNGQLYPDPPVTGQPQYSWNGTQWLSSKAAVTQIARTDALGWSGMQINGSMEVSQELGTSPTTIGPKTYVTDGWALQSAGTQVVNAGKSTIAPPGFTSSVHAAIGTANAAPAAGHFLFYSQRIEGYRVSRLGWGTASAQSLTIAFWVRARRTGTYSGAIRNGAGNRSYVFSFNISASETYEYKVITIPGDTTGTWPTDNTAAFELDITMMTGSTYTTTAGAWVAGGFVGATGTTNGVAATTDYMLLTGVVVLPGVEAPTAAQSPLIMRPYDQELMTCKRYYEKNLDFVNGTRFSGSVTSGQGYFYTHNFNVEKRASPTMTVISTDAVGFPATAGSSGSSRQGFYETRTANSTNAGGRFGSDWVADARL